MNAIKDAVLAILKRVPEPHVQAVAGTIEAVITMVRHQPAGFTEAGVHAEIDAAVAEALAPWQRIKDRADAESGGCLCPNAGRDGIYDSICPIPAHRAKGRQQAGQPRDVAGYVGGEHDDY